MIKEGSIYWLFYSANLWGTPNYSIGIAACTSVTGPCVKPLDRPWHKSTDSAKGQGYGGSEFFQTGSLIWMVHHGLVPGESGNYSERRLYVDLMVFPPSGLPEVAARAPAAAMAEAELYDDEPSLRCACRGLRASDLDSARPGCVRRHGRAVGDHGR